MTTSPFPLFTLRGAAYAVPGRVLLHPMDLELLPGRSYALIGHNGSGKSTLLKLLARHLTPTAGGIALEGTPLPAWRGRAYARKVAYLPQVTPAASGLLVRELVALGRYPWHGALGRFTRKDHEAVDTALALTDLRPYAGRLVDTLSGGEKQRAWLAMLVAQDAQCLLLDEPTSALDIGHQLEVLELVHRLAREHGLGVVTVLHDINMASRFCDEILGLHSGRLIVRGTPEQIMNSDELMRIYGVSMEVLPPARLGHLLAFPR